MRRRQLKKLWARLKELQQMAPTRDTLLLKLGAAKSQYPSGWRLVKIEVGQEGELSFCLRKDKLREVRQREGRYLLRSNLGSENPAQLWQLYVLLTQIEEAFKNLKGDLAVRPIFHQLEKRIEAHIFVAFLAFCLHATLRRKLQLKAPGLNASIGFRATLGHSNARRPLPNHGWALANLSQIYLAQQSPKAPHRTTRARAARPKSPQNYPASFARTSAISHLLVVKTF
jgi:hypothetical protein